MRKFVNGLGVAVLVLSTWAGAIMPAAAQQPSATTDVTTTTVPVEREHHEFPWGLLGLLGLAGLIPRKHVVSNNDRTTTTRM